MQALNVMRYHLGQYFGRNLSDHLLMALTSSRAFRFVRIVSQRINVPV